MERCAGSEKRRDVLGALRGSSEMRAQKWDDGERSGARADGMRMGHDCEAEGSDRLERAPVCKRCSVNSTVGCGTVCYVHRHVGGPRSSGGGAVFWAEPGVIACGRCCGIWAWGLLGLVDVVGVEKLA